MSGYWLGENCNIQSLASYQALTRKHSVDYRIYRLHIKVNVTHCPHVAPMLEETLRKCCTLGQFNVKREHIFYPLHFEQPVHSVSSNVHSSSLLQWSSKLSVWQTHNLGGTKNCSRCTAPSPLICARSCRYSGSPPGLWASVVFASLKKSRKKSATAGWLLHPHGRLSGRNQERSIACVSCEFSLLKNSRSIMRNMEKRKLDKGQHMVEMSKNWRSSGEIMEICGSCNPITPLVEKKSVS